MKLSELKVDHTKLEQGAWIDNIPEMGQLRLKVRGLGNVDYRRMMNRLTEALPRAKRVGGRIDPDEQDKLVSSCLLATVLLDWDGLEGDDGEPVPYTRELAHDLLHKPEFRRFREGVIWAASVLSDQEAEGVKEAAGN